MPDNKEIYTSMAALSRAKDIPVDHLKAAKHLNCSGYSPSGRWTWTEFDLWYQANREAVLEYVEENQSDSGDNGAWKARKERAQALIAEIQLRELQGRTLDKEKVVKLLKSISSSQSIVLRNMAQELPHKLLGKSLTETQVILTKAYEDVCKLLQHPITEWAKGETTQCNNGNMN